MAFPRRRRVRQEAQRTQEIKLRSSHRERLWENSHYEDVQGTGKRAGGGRSSTSGIYPMQTMLPLAPDLPPLLQTMSRTTFLDPDDVNKSISQKRGKRHR